MSDNAVANGVRFHDCKDAYEWELLLLLHEGSKKLALRKCCTTDGVHHYYVKNNSKPCVMARCIHCNGVKYVVNQSVWGRGDRISIVYINALLEARIQNNKLAEESIEYDSDVENFLVVEM
jgi:hypothetical protein